MAKKKASSKVSPVNKTNLLEGLAIVLALFFMHYVTTSAQDLFLSSDQKTSGIVETPYMLGFVFAVLIVAYYLEKRKVLSVLSVLILTILAVSGYFWIFALRTT